MCSYWLRTWRPIKQTPYVIFYCLSFKIILCMLILCDTEEISGSIFCARCRLEVDRAPYRYMPTYSEPQGFASMHKEPIFKRRARPKMVPKEKYIPVSPSEVPLLVGKERDKEIKDQILGYLGLEDEN